MWPVVTNVIGVCYGQLLIWVINPHYFRWDHTYNHKQQFFFCFCFFWTCKKNKMNYSNTWRTLFTMYDYIKCCQFTFSWSFPWPPSCPTTFTARIYTSHYLTDYKLKYTHKAISCLPGKIINYFIYCTYIMPSTL